MGRNTSRRTKEPIASYTYATFIRVSGTELANQAGPGRGLGYKCSKLRSQPSGYEQPTKRELRTASDRVDYPVSERRLTTTKVAIGPGSSAY